MAVNRGKDFEQQIRESFERVDNTSVTRLIDPQAGYAGVRNICDFIVYHHPYQYMVECKCHYGNTLPFSCITDNQWQGLLQESYHKGVRAGIMVWFIDHDVTAYVPIQWLEELKLNGKKSLHINDVVGDLTLAVPVYGKKKRILFDYDMERFFRFFA